VAGYIPKWFTRPQTVTHQSINRARSRVTTLIETNALPIKTKTKLNTVGFLQHVQLSYGITERLRALYTVLQCHVSSHNLSTSQLSTRGVHAATSRSSGHSSSPEQSGSGRSCSLMTLATRSCRCPVDPPSQSYLMNARLAAIGVLWLVVQRLATCNA